MTSEVQIKGTMRVVLDALKRPDASNGLTVENVAASCGITKNAAKGALARLRSHGLAMSSKQASRNVWIATPEHIDAGVTDPPVHTPPLHGNLPVA